MEDQNRTDHDRQINSGLDDGPRGEIDSAAPAIGALAIEAIDAGQTPGEQQPVPDERIEQLARAAAQGATTGPEADIRYEYRKRALLRKKALLERDRRLVVARKRASEARPA
jgi:hypothetical protein